MRPDFYIVGAQKAGTTTLAALLDAVAGVSLSHPKEPMFFCHDDYLVHRNELLHPAATWQDFDWDRDREDLLSRYAACFAGAGEGDLLGEASTTYALSSVAAQRIAATTPEAKIIMILRDPVARAWSAYWHCVRKAIATRSFEQEIRFGGANLIEFGHYAEQLERYRQLFGPERVKVVHFEDLVQESDRVLKPLLEFLGIEAGEEPLPQPRKLNESYYPRFVGLHRLAVAVMRPRRELASHSSLALEASSEAPRSSSGLRGLYRRFAMTESIPGKMNPDTRTALRAHFRRVNAPLNELLGEDIFARWGW